MAFQKIKHISKRIREGALKTMLHQTRWIYRYARHYWLVILFYTLIGLLGTVVSLGSSLVSKDL
ncbi:MAG TPA: ABC transporter ATP-binding protein, partial [Lachnospiraceae bacterium]|nr:ABC transporter ATP-binding protein [Lachnospiraceae bacterium]